MNQISTILYLLFQSYCLASEGYLRFSGQFLCNGEPWRSEKVSVYESNFLLPDQLLTVNYTDFNGNFYLEAYGEDIYPLRPYVYLPNYCDPVKFLGREWARYLRIPIPNFYVDSDPEVLDMGQIELSQEGTAQFGFQKLTDWIKNFAESRPVRRERKLKMSEI